MTSPLKYKLVGKPRVKFSPSEGREIALHQIQALIDLPKHGVKAGDIGGWVEGPHNLNQEGACWVEGEAEVYGEARVTDDALIRCQARVYGSAVVAGDATVEGVAKVYGKALISGSARVSGNSDICGHADVSGSAVVHDTDIEDHAVIKDNVKIVDSYVRDRAVVRGDMTIRNAYIIEYAHIEGSGTLEKIAASGHACISGNVTLHKVIISDHALIMGDVVLRGKQEDGMNTSCRVRGRMIFRDGAYVTHPEHMLAISPIGRDLDTLTAYTGVTTGEDGKQQAVIRVARGLYTGTIDEFIDHVIEKDAGERKEETFIYLQLAPLIKSHFARAVKELQAVLDAQASESH